MGSMIHEELGEYLTLISRDGAYRVVATLKESAFETTEQVVFCGANGAERGPYVRKRIARQAGLGAVYQELLQAQRQGRRFVHLPHIEECYELGEEFVVVMEHVEGATLHELVYERDPSWELASEVFPLLCDAVSELHEGLEAPIIHRDLKPSNVILSAANLTLIDFGIARAYRDGAERDTAAFGTRAYAPPEQFGFGQTDVRSDVYALGMLLYYLLTEQVPSPALAGGPFAEATVPQALRPVLAKATAFDPAARYGSARELRDAFEAAGRWLGWWAAWGQRVRRAAWRRAWQVAWHRRGCHPARRRWRRPVRCWRQRCRRRWRSRRRPGLRCPDRSSSPPAGSPEGCGVSPSGSAWPGTPSWCCSWQPPSRRPPT